MNRIHYLHIDHNAPCLPPPPPPPPQGKKNGLRFLLLTHEMEGTVKVSFTTAT